MAVSYKKLWHILLDRDMKKRDLQEAAGLTKYAINKLSRDENVSTEVLGKICSALNCTTDDNSGVVCPKKRKRMGSQDE